MCLRIEQIGIAVERARQPHLFFEPVILGDATGGGAVTVVSDEAAGFGIRVGLAIGTARALCSEDLVVLPYDRLAYEVAAEAVWQLLAVDSNIVEPAGAETAYAVFEGSAEVVSSRVQAITEALAVRLGVPVRAGIARTKFSARTAACNGDPSVPTCVPVGADERLLAMIPISEIANIPNKAVQSLAKVGIHCLGDIVRLPPHRLPVALRKDGARLRQLASGFDADPVRALWPARSAEVSVRFDDGVEDLATIEREIGRLCEQIAAKLSAKSEFCRKIDLSVGLEDGTFLSESVRLTLPESRAAPLTRAALRALQAMARPLAGALAESEECDEAQARTAASGIDQPVVSIAITASGLGAGGGVQLSLPNEHGEMAGERAKRLEAMIETLRRAYGPRVVIPAALLQKARRIDLWVMPFAYRLSEPASRVATDDHGNPVRFWWRPRGSQARKGGAPERRDVVRRYARWRETGRSRDAGPGAGGGELVDIDVWRVETDPAGISEIRHLQTEWRVSASYD